jgi:hypothetical protein
MMPNKGLVSVRQTNPGISEKNKTTGFLKPGCRVQEKVPQFYDNANLAVLAIHAGITEQKWCEPGIERFSPKNDRR